MTDLLCRLFVKNAEKTADPQVRRAYGTLASTVGILLNLVLFAAKFAVGLLFGSVSIVGDSINSLSDAGSQIISLVTFRISVKPADRKHPFGHARIEYVSSMIVSFLILLIGFELLKESVTKILSPTLPERSWIAVAVLAGSILTKLWMGIFNRRLAKRIDSSVMRATAADSFSDALSTSAVLLSTLILFLFPSITINLDAYMGVIVAIMIVIAGAKILNETKNSILGEAPSDEIVALITEVVNATPGALGIHDLVVHNYGPGHVIAALHVEVDGAIDIFETHDMIDNIEQILRQEHHIEATIHMDPIVTDDEKIASLRARTAEAILDIDPSLRLHDFRFVPGLTHTNLIFDVVVPFEVSMSDDEVQSAVSQTVAQIDPSYFAVVKIDRE